MKNFLLLLGLLILFFTGCGDSDQNVLDEIHFVENKLEVDYGEEVLLSVYPEPIEAKLPKIVFNSENTIVASVSKEGVVKGLKAGETKITVHTIDGRLSATSHIIVNPTNFLYQEPCFDFGANIPQIKSKEKRNLAYQKGMSLVFEGENEYVSTIAYSFRNGMSSITVEFPDRDDIVPYVEDYIKQRYLFMKRENERDYFLSPHDRVWVILENNLSGKFSAMYTHSYFLFNGYIE